MSVTVYICPRCNRIFHAPGTCPTCHTELEAQPAEEMEK